MNLKITALSGFVGSGLPLFLPFPYDCLTMNDAETLIATMTTKARLAAVTLARADDAAKADSLKSISAALRQRSADICDCWTSFNGSARWNNLTMRGRPPSKRR